MTHPKPLPHETSKSETGTLVAILYLVEVVVVNVVVGEVV
jgi:hypothetical protein